MNTDLTTLTINLPTDLVTRIDEYADQMGINRTTAIKLLCKLQLD